MSRMRFAKNIMIYLSILILYILSLTAVAKIPNEYIKNNINKSSEQLLIKNEKTYLRFFNKNIILFNFTDALMLNTIYSTDDNNPLESSLLARRNYIKGQTKDVYQDTTPPGAVIQNAAEYNANMYQTKELSETVNGRNTYNCIEYARYWHGYMIILKPLLLVLNYNQIVILSIICFIVISTIFLYLVMKKIGFKEMLIFFIAFLMTDVYIASASLNAIVPFYIGIIVGIIFLLNNNIKSYGLIFVIIGSVTSFFDFLTTPLITLGIPLIIKLLLENKYKKVSILSTIKMCIWWGIGYGSTMIAKWIITDILLNRQVFETSVRQFLYRIGDTTEGIDYTFWSTLKANLYFLGNTINTPIFIVLIISVIFYYILRKKKLTKKEINLLIVSIIPFAWFMLLKNHSTIHSFFTYRNFIIVIICILLLAVNILTEERKKLK